MSRKGVLDRFLRRYKAVTKRLGTPVRRLHLGRLSSQIAAGILQFANSFSNCFSGFEDGTYASTVAPDFLPYRVVAESQHTVAAASCDDCREEYSSAESADQGGGRTWGTIW